MLFIGCVPQSKLAKVCAERYPVKEEIKETLIIDTVRIQGDTIRLNKTDTAYVICPPSKVITKTKEVKIKAENTAKTHSIKQECDKQLQTKDKEIEKLKKDLNKRDQKIGEYKEKLEDVKKYKWWFFSLIGIIALILLYRLSRWFKPLP